MVADRLAKGLKCPLMSQPVMVSAADCQTYQLFKASCMGEECVCSYTTTQIAENNRLIRILHCSYLDIQVGELDDKSTT